MGLLSVLPDIWLRIFLEWLTLVDVIRCDCAASVLTSNPLLPIIAYQEFTLPIQKTLCARQLNKLNLWLREKNAYITSFNFQGCANYSLCNTLEALMVWSGSKIRVLNLWHEDEKSTQHLLYLIPNYCTNLFKLILSNLSKHHYVRNLLCNNSETLHTLIFSENYVYPKKLGFGDYTLPHLKVLKLANKDVDTHFYDVDSGPNVANFIRKCPGLTTLSVTLSYEIATAVAETCTQLRRLHIKSRYNMNNQVLLRVVHGCPLIEYLEICGQSGEPLHRLGEALNALPFLHTLVIDDLVDDIHSHLFTHGAPAQLRTLSIHCKSEDELRRITEACPQLTGLDISGFQFNSCQEFDFGISVLQFCGELKHFRYVCRKSTFFADTDKMLLSIAQHCPLLQSLSIYSCSQELLNKVLNKCTQLKEVRVAEIWPSCHATPRQHSRGVRIVVSKVAVMAPMAEWLPP